MTNISINLETKGFNEIAKRLENSPVVLNEVMRQMIQKLTFIGMGAAKEASPVNKGILRSSITQKVEGLGLDMVGRIGTTISYAKYQEDGTGIFGPTAQPIVPKRAKILSFIGKDGGRVFARSVKGTQGKHYFKAGVEKVKSSIKSTINFGYEVIHQRFGL